MKYRKKPVVVEAFLWTGENVQQFAAWAAECDFSHKKAAGIAKPTVELPLTIETSTVVLDPVSNTMRTVGGWVDIKTLEGVMRANPGDWIICGVNGEFYPCKADIFAKTYDQVSYLSEVP